MQDHTELELVATLNEWRRLRHDLIEAGMDVEKAPSIVRLMELLGELENG